MFVNKVNKINSFKELLNEIGWSWDYPSHNLLRDKEGNFILNKLYITPTTVSYKEDNWDLSPGVFENVVKFYEFLESIKDPV